MRKKTRTLLIGGTQTASGKSLLTLAFANVLRDRGVSVTIVHCDYETVTWTRVSPNKRQHQWQTELESPEQLENFWLDLQFIKTDYLLIDLASSGPRHANYTWLLNQCWLPLADEVILTYSAKSDLSQQLFEDLGTLQFSMEYTNTHPTIYTVFNDCPSPAAVKQVLPAKELVPFHREFQFQYSEFAALDLQPLGTLADARQNPGRVIDDVEHFLDKLVA
ncbi:hypothetical protein D1831_07405 [Lactiplantibacillus garii]|uniref:CobQ/CobB/MinD/ParA nucleotide binding domain-containing protein n=1 Tax=Lactiplantibacillus garii TaxID=2306423 RepID=A0A426D7A7_9LACO|nr:hypothetical protein [Lactiplantibacillus garii]RRK10480.1 hypothetical protein D1831_07405 [Lactiplantibacillus garii]